MLGLKAVALAVAKVRKLAVVIMHKAEIGSGSGIVRNNRAMKTFQAMHKYFKATTTYPFPMHDN